MPGPEVGAQTSIPGDLPHARRVSAREIHLGQVDELSRTSIQNRL